LANRFELRELFYIVKEIRSEPTVEIARNPGQDYETVLNLVLNVQVVSEVINNKLYDVCEANEVYMIDGEKELIWMRDSESDNALARNLKIKN